MRGFRSHDVRPARLDAAGQRGDRGARPVRPALAGRARGSRRSRPSSGDAPAGARRRRAVRRRPRAHGPAAQRAHARSASTSQRRRGRRTTFRVAGDGLLAGAPRGARRCWSTRCSPGSGDVDGATVLDLYAGRRAVHRCRSPDAVGETGEVVAVEGDARAVRDARRNLHDRPQVELHAGDVAAGARRPADADSDVVHADVVVLDPPRAGAGREVVDADRRAAARARRLRRVRPGGAGPRRRAASPTPGYALAGPAGVRPVPDDAPRRGGRGPRRADARVHVRWRSAG